MLQQRQQQLVQVLAQALEQVLVELHNGRHRGVAPMRVSAAASMTVFAAQLGRWTAPHRGRPSQ